MEVLPASFLDGEIVLPGDKSVSHRSAILAAMANGVTHIYNFSASADCASTIACLRALGVSVKKVGSEVTVHGVGKTGFTAPSEPLDCGNSGTTMRLISGALAGQPFDSVLTGDDSLRGRPMRRVIVPLTHMGAAIEAADGTAPLLVRGRHPLSAADIVPEVASAQIKSAVLLAGLNAEGTTSVSESTPTRDHTERMLRWLGVEVEESAVAGGRKLSVSGDAVLTARDLVVPSDISAAVFFMVAASCLPGSDIVMKGVGVNGSRQAVIDVLRRFGAMIEISNEREICNEPVADIQVRGGLNQAMASASNRVDGDTIAGIIDEIPALAIFGTQLDGGLTIRDAGELRVKESDRISTVVANLKKMGADVEEFEDGFRVGRSRLKGADVDPAGDHRIAMAFAVAGLFAEGSTTIEDADCCAVSFPGFFEVLNASARRS
jgi:3-phosphoshikimate 1-carboxyvinyltransferase